MALEQIMHVRLPRAVAQPKRAAAYEGTFAARRRTHGNLEAWMHAPNSPNPPPRPRPSDAASAVFPWPSAVHALGVAAALYPLFFAAAYYGEYLLAWLHLGHAPAPSLNDPKGIHPWLHTAVVVLFLCLPGAVVVSVALTFGALRFKLASHARLALHIGLSLTSWALLWTLLSCDALQHINTWWAD